MEFMFKTKNTCSKIVKFTLNGNIVTNVQFLEGGCPGNLQAVSKLVEGMTVDEIESKIGGIICGKKGTSCADQLVKSIKKAYEESNKNQKNI